MISQTLEYALRAAVHLAGEAGSRTTADIAIATRVPTAYLAKVLQQLARAGIVRGQRGPSGGFVLKMAPEKVTMWHVMDAVEPLRRIRECPLDLKTHKSRLCPLHRTLDEAIANLEKTFKGITIAQLIGDANAPRPLCDVPASALPVKGRISLS
jgi:Rrf2 family nitric oxide-sensitive transcriptional repressor